MPTSLQQLKNRLVCDRYYNKKGVNAGVFASKYSFGISNLRCETAAVSIATSSKRKSAYSCIFLPKEVLGFEGHAPRFGGRLFDGFV